MLAQIIKLPRVSVQDDGAPDLDVQFGDIVFMAKKEGPWCTIIHKENVYKITIDNLLYVKSHKDVLTKPQVLAKEYQQDQKNMAAIESLFSQK